MSAEWLGQRKGRITATKMKAVSTKMDTLSRSGNASGIDSLVKTDWFRHFIAFAKPTNNKPVLIVLDGHATHTKNIEVIDLAR